jgi:hypothetical protein
MIPRRSVLMGGAGLAALGLFCLSPIESYSRPIHGGIANGSGPTYTPYETNVLLKPAILGFWPLGDNSGVTSFADISGNSNAPIISGGVTPGVTGLSLDSFNLAATFNGSTGYASFASSSLFSLEHTAPWSVECLLKVSSIANAQECAIFAKMANNSSRQGYLVGIIGTGTNTGVVEVQLNNNAAAGANQISVKSSIALTAGTVYHITVSYSGSGLASGIAIWVNGLVDQSPSVLVNNLSATIINSVVASIGSYGPGAAAFFPGTLQYITLYGTSAPNGGDSTQAGYLNTYGYNIASPADYCLALGLTPPSDPSGVPNVIIDTDICGDWDDCMDVQTLCALHFQGKINIIGAAICSDNVDSASTVQSFFDYWDITAPVYAYQGNAFGSQPSNYTTQTGLQFEPGDASNEGCTSYSISGGGTANQVGDVLTVPGGTLATGSASYFGVNRGRATKLTVSSVSGGAITGFSISDSGSYSTPPSGTITLPNLHSGTAATVTLTYTVRRGNYTNALTGYRKLFAANSNIYVIGLGFAINFATVLASASDAGGDGYASGVTLITNGCKALLPVAGWSSSMTQQQQSVPDYNIATDQSNWNALVSGSPVWPTPIIECAIEVSDPAGQPYAIGGLPATLANYLTIPLQYSYWANFGGGYGSIEIWYSCCAILWVGNGGMRSGQLYWGEISSTELLSSGNSTLFTQGTPPWSSLRKKATDAAFESILASLLAATP